MNAIDLDLLKDVTGGAKTSAVRDAIKLLKSTGPVNPYDLGGAAHDLSHTNSGLHGAMDRPRSWLGGGSLNGRIDRLLSISGMAH